MVTVGHTLLFVVLVLLVGERVVRYFLVDDRHRFCTASDSITVIFQAYRYIFCRHLE